MIGEVLELARDARGLVERGVVALERIADALERRRAKQQPRRSRQPDPEITELDRSAARDAARRLGLQVKGRTD